MMAQLSLWHEKLAELDAKYNIEQFVFIGMDLPEDHANLDIINRILDLLDALRQQEDKFYASVDYTQDSG